MVGLVIRAIFTKLAIQSVHLAYEEYQIRMCILARGWNEKPNIAIFLRNASTCCQLLLLQPYEWMVEPLRRPEVSSNLIRWRILTSALDTNCNALIQASSSSLESKVDAVIHAVLG